jgi:hypothetical protein
VVVWECSSIDVNVRSGGHLALASALVLDLGGVLASSRDPQSAHALLKWPILVVPHSEQCVAVLGIPDYFRRAMALTSTEAWADSVGELNAASSASARASSTLGNRWP